MIQLLQPGLQNDEIDRLSEPLGFPLPEEVRTWYRWHNGSSNQPIILWRAVGTLADDVTTTLAYEREEEQWQEGWIQVMDDKPLIIFDCRGGVAAPVPVWHLDYAFAFPTRPVFDSIGDMVSFWIELIDDGQIYWDPDGEQHMREPVPDAVHQRIRGVPTD